MPEVTPGENEQPEATVEGQVLPAPNCCRPVFFSVLTLPSSWNSVPNHFDPPSRKPLRLVESSVS